PSLTVTSSAPAVCEGDTATLTASGASSFKWASYGTNPEIKVFPPVSRTYTVTSTDSLGCSDEATLSIEVKPVPVLLVLSTQSVLCKGNSATLTVAGAADYSWMPPGSGSQQIVSPTVTTTYTIIGTA